MTLQHSLLWLHLFITLSLVSPFKCLFKGLKDDSAAKRGRKFSSQYPSQKFHNCLCLQVQGTWCLLLAHSCIDPLKKQTTKHNHVTCLNIRYFTFVCLCVLFCYLHNTNMELRGQLLSLLEPILSYQVNPRDQSWVLTESTNGCLASLFGWACRPSLIFQYC